MEKWITPKSEKEIKKQINGVENQLGAKVAPDSVDCSKFSGDELKEKFPERYAIYLQILRAQKNKQEIEGDALKKMQEWMQVLNNLDDYIASHESKEETRVLRERQFDVFKDIRKFLEEGGKEGYIKLPTGVGKTVLFSQIVEVMKLKTLIVVPSKILVSQTGERLEEFTDLEFGRYYEEEKDFSKSVTLTTYQSLIRGIEGGVIGPDDFGLMILDEAHKSLGEKTLEIVRKMNSLKLGFTATPEYSREKHLSQLLEREIHQMSVIEAVQEGLISRFKVIVARTNIDLSGVSIVGGEYNSQEIEKAVNNQARNLSAVELYQKAFAGESAVVFCSGVEHAAAVAKLFQQSGIEAEVISGQTEKQARDIILEKFRNGKIKVLCNARVLTEGFDEPRASVALNLHPTLSRVNAEQRGGRVLRLDKSNPEKWAVVVDFIDESAKIPPVLFSEVAESSEGWPAEKSPDRSDRKEKAEEGIERFRGMENIQIDGLKIATNAQEVMRIGDEFESERRKEFAKIFLQEGWVNVNQLKKESVAAIETIRKFVEPYRATNPEWFAVGISETGIRAVEGYHPELAQIIRDHFGGIELTEGWMNRNQLRKESIAAPETIKKFVEQYRVVHPEWFKTSISGEGYHPELVQIIRDHFKGRKLPEGWVTANQLNKESVAAIATIKKFVEQYRAIHPEWFKVGSSGMKITEGYHPELVQIIRNHFEEGKILDGWITASQLSRESIAAIATIRKFTEPYRITNPEWFKTGISGEGYHPELVQIIRNHFGEGKITEGWITASQLKKELVASDSTIKKFAERYRTTNPDWFMAGRPKSGSKITEGYHPELVKIIRDHFSKKI